MTYSYVGFNGPLSLTSNAILSQQLGLQSTAANIANANAPGYHRNDTVIVAGGAIGGVEEATLVRAGNRALEQQQTVELGKQSAADNRSVLLQAQIKPLLGTIDESQSISGALGKLFDNLQSLSENPANEPMRQVALTSAGVLTNRLNSVANSLIDQQMGLNERTEVIVNVSNGLLTTIADLNNRITSGQASGAPTGDLEDQRGSAASSLAQLIGTQVLWDDNGQMRVVLGDGVSLVSSIEVSPLTINADAVTSADHIGLANSPLTNLDSQITRGEAGAIIQVRDTDLPTARLRLDQFAANLATAFNNVHGANYATDANSTTGLNFFNLPTTTSPTGYANGISVNPDIVANGGELLAVAGLPTAKSGDNRGVSALLAINTTGGLQSQLGDIVTSTGTLLQGATADTDREDALMVQITNMVESQAGVNIEEQLLQLSRYQTAFTAATRIVSTVDQMLQALLSM